MSLKSGEIIQGTVSKITKYGAFIKLSDGKTGLCHISEISNDYVKDINTYLKEGQEVKVKILNIKDDNKMELSIKQASKNSSNDKKHKSNTYKKPKQSFENMLSDFLKSSDEKLKGINERTKRY
ncbi:S1 RNA-binding domain-containing protein [Crassaminicella thermophila]|uniref:S1 RNA-binding domain-containing protein n=1 Tax=Crassaminicella thermophila TaxID=2599308 RepID=A0A5C0SAZ2_CRATE|nr:S1 RNA-binding domain-containing protein [Crassaminicella thermophila]QEK11351.1 S1 RNA-binding domain-containing protein [Crassaminicella thermophila]